MPHLWACLSARAVAAGALPAVRHVLAHARPRAPTGPAACYGWGFTAVHALWPTDPPVDARELLGLLRVLASDRPRAPSRVVATLSGSVWGGNIRSLL